MFSWSNKKDISIFRMKKAPYLLLCLFSFLDNNLGNINGFSPNLLCELILWRFGWDCQWANFFNFSQSYLAATHPYFLFPDDNLSNCQWLFTKLGMCIDVLEIWFGIANGQISCYETVLFI